MVVPGAMRPRWQVTDGGTRSDAAEMACPVRYKEWTKWKYVSDGERHGTPAAHGLLFFDETITKRGICTTDPRPA